MAFPKFVIILMIMPSTFNTLWDATGWPNRLQRSFYEKRSVWRHPKKPIVRSSLPPLWSNIRYEYDRLGRW